MWIVYPLAVLALQYGWQLALLLLNIAIGGFPVWIDDLTFIPLVLAAGCFGVWMMRVASVRWPSHKLLVAPTVWLAVFFLGTIGSVRPGPPTSMFDAAILLQGTGATALYLYLGMVMHLGCSRSRQDLAR